MDKDQLISTLMTEYGFWETTATAFVEAKGKCRYCDENLYINRIRYSAINIDHLYPRNLYPSVANNPNNLILCCFRCNNLKRAKDFFNEEKDPLSKLVNDKEELISIVKEELADLIEKDKRLNENLNTLLKW